MSVTRQIQRCQKDVLILAPAKKVDDRRAEYSDIEVKPTAFSASELKTAHRKFLMGAIGGQHKHMYMRQINLIMRGLRGNLTLDALRAGIVLTLVCPTTSKSWPRRGYCLLANT